MPHKAPHVLQVIGSSTFGGATRVIMAICRGLQEEGYRVSVLTSDAKSQAAFASMGVNVIPCRHFTREIHPVADAAAIAELIGVCRREGVDVLHTHTSKGGVVGRTAAALLRLPVVHTVHGFSFHDFSADLERAIFTTIERACARVTARLVLMNADEEKLVREEGWCPPERIRRIANGIPVPPAPAPVSSHQGHPVLTAVGRLAEQKGYRDLLAAMPRVLAVYPDAKLYIVGDGEQRAVLEAHAKALGLDTAVVFTGFQPDPLAWLERAHVAVSSSLWEGMPIAILEMMAMRRPIVATACRGTRDVLRDGENALLAPCSDPIRLADAILAMLGDESRAAQLADAARYDLVTHYPESRMVDEYVTLIGEVAPMPRTVQQPIELHPMWVEDVPAAVRVHLDAFPGFFLSILGPAFLRNLYAGFCSEVDGIGYVATDANGTTLGVVAGTVQPQGFFKRLLLSHWWKFGLSALPAILRDPSCLPRVARALFYRGDAPHNPGALLSTIAVTPDAQGHGVGKALIEAFCTEALLRGASRVYLTTDAVGNDAVNHFYTRQGFTLDGAYQTSEGRAMNRYVRELAAQPE
jgi:glycosyltransferase involved in cell wall biosynthesis/GNAT superfamily N-acetyltransferase